LEAKQQGGQQGYTSRFHKLYRYVLKNRENSARRDFCGRLVLAPVQIPLAGAQKKRRLIICSYEKIPTFNP
jgi:hypothetical protein